MCPGIQHTVGPVLAELGELQLKIRGYLRHSNLSVTNKYLQAVSNTERSAQARLVEAILPVFAARENHRNGCTLFALESKSTQTPKVPIYKPLKRIGGDDGTRTRGLCRDRAAF